MSDTYMSRDEIETMIIAKVVEDPKFGEALKADPKAALASMFDTKLPPEMNVHVFQETPKDLMIRLPIVVSDEVTEEELEGVAGGACTPLLKVIGIAAAKGILQGLGGAGVTYAAIKIPNIKKW